jgi:PPOX class probable F420-dependent enzyme
VTELPQDLRALIESGPLVHLATINADGSPQVTAVWVGLDGDELLTAHLGDRAKLRNMERDPRVVLSLQAPRKPDTFLTEYAALTARARIEPTDKAWDLLNDLSKTYYRPDADFPAPRTPGYIVHYTIEKIGGEGPWVTRQRH